MLSVIAKLHWTFAPRTCHVSAHIISLLYNKFASGYIYGSDVSRLFRKNDTDNCNVFACCYADRGQRKAIKAPVTVDQIGDYLLRIYDTTREHGKTNGPKSMIFWLSRTFANNSGLLLNLPRGVYLPRGHGSFPHDVRMGPPIFDYDVP